MTESAPSEPAAVAAVDDTGLAWQRLREALRPHRTRDQLVVAALLLALGFAFAVQVRSARGDVDLRSASESDLVQILDDVNAQRDRLEAELRDLQITHDRLASGSDARAVAEREAQDRARSLGVIAGVLPATGPGAVITIRDPSSTVDSGLLLSAVSELRDAGAEAIQIDDVRVVASTWFGDDFADGHPVVTVDGEPVTAPYVITAIGDPATIETALRIPGGVVDETDLVGGAVRVEQRKMVAVTAVHAPEPLTHASAAPSSS